MFLCNALCAVGLQIIYPGFPGCGDFQDFTRTDTDRHGLTRTDTDLYGRGHFCSLLSDALVHRNCRRSTTANQGEWRFIDYRLLTIDYF